MVVSAVAGGFVRRGSSRTNGTGVCRCSGSESIGIQDTDCGGGAAQLWCEPSVKGLAVRIYDKEPQQRRSGTGVHGSNGNALADGYESCRSHDAVAIVEGL